MKDLGWSDENGNPFMPKLKTRADVEAFQASGGIGAIEGRIEAAFRSRFDDLKDKIVRLNEMAETDMFLKNLLITSILVDTRALLLEDEKLERNATLQNVYLARRLVERAKNVDAALDREILPGKNFREIIKCWVDKRVVRMDWMWDEDEASAYMDMDEVFFSDGIYSFTAVLLSLIEEYEGVVARLGKNAREQMELAITALTSD